MSAAEFEGGKDHGRQSPEGPFGGLSSPPTAQSGKLTPPHEENSGVSGDPWSFIAPLMPAVRAIGEMFKPIIDASGFEQDIGDIIAALNETSRNPLFLFGIEDTPPLTEGLVKNPPMHHGTVQRQQQNSSTSAQLKPSSQPRGSPLLSFRGLFSQDQGAPETQAGPEDGVQTHTAFEKDHRPVQSEEEVDDSSLWRQWDREELDLL